MSLSSLSRALARSARSSRSRQGSLLGGRGGLRAPLPGGGSSGLGSVRGYLTSALGSRAAVANGAGNVGDWRCLLASSQFRRLFSDQSNNNYEKYFPKEKKEKPKGDGSNKSDSKKESNSDDQWNFQKNAAKLFHDILAPLLLLGVLLSSISLGSSEQEISFQEFRNKLLEPGLVDHIVVSNKSVAKVYVRNSPSTNQKPE